MRRKLNKFKIVLNFLSVPLFHFFLHPLIFFFSFDLEPSINTIRPLARLGHHLGHEDGAPGREGLTYYVRLSE